MRISIVGLGNPIRGDDGVGIHAASALAVRLQDCEAVQVAECPAGGMAVVELLSGSDHAVLIDATVAGAAPPGTVLCLAGEELATAPAVASLHELNLSTALELGRELGLPMPADVVVFAITCSPPEGFGEDLSPAVAGAAVEVCDLVEELVRGWLAGSPPAGPQ